MSKLKELAKDYFDRHSGSKECFITADGRVFHQHGTASGYAAALKDNTVEKFTRDGKDTDDNTTGKDALTIADFNPETTTYAEAKALVKALGLEVKSQKQDDLFAVLTEAQTQAKSKEQE